MLKHSETRIVLNEHELFDVKYSNRKWQEGITPIENGKTNVHCVSRDFGLAVKFLKIANA